MSSTRKFRHHAAPAAEPLDHPPFLTAAPVNINTAQKFQTIEGFGAAMTPWELKGEYTTPAFFDTIVNDLGASMARAAILPTAERVNDDADPNHINLAGFDHKALAMPFEFF